MYLKEMTLNQYRNYLSQTLYFSSEVNIFLGENAQGKTNLMESIHVLALTKSHRTQKEKELIQFGKDFSRIDATLHKEDKDFLLKLIIHKNGKKAKIGHVEQKKYSLQMKNIMFVKDNFYIDLKSFLLNTFYFCFIISVT